MNHPNDEDDAAAPAIAEVLDDDDDAVVAANDNDNDDEDDDDNDNEDEDEDEDEDDEDDDAEDNDNDELPWFINDNDNNDDNDDDDDDDEDTVVDVATLDLLAPDVCDRICNEAITFLLDRLKFPSRFRDRTIVRFAEQFVNNVKEDIHKTITDTRLVEEGYDGLDSVRDTEEEVETAIRSCPEVLTRRDERFGCYPIKCLTLMESDDNTKDASNVNAASFVHLFVRLAIEFTSFEEHERGGLLIADEGGSNVLHDLVGCSDSSYDEIHHQLVDTTFLAVLIRLRQSGYFLKEYIQQYDLVHRNCKPDQRIRYLIEWDPSSLLQPNEFRQLPLHFVTSDLQSFRFVFDSVIRFYPRWRGINTLFQKCSHGYTPFQLACDNLTRAKVMEVVEDILVRYTTNNGLVNSDNIGNAMILAATDNTVSLDGLYFSIRRQPNTMLSMLRHREEEESTPMVSSMLSSSNNTSIINNRPANQKIIDSVVNNTDTNNTNDTDNDDNDASNNNHNNGKLRRSTRKRKHT